MSMRVSLSVGTSAHLPTCPPVVVLVFWSWIFPQGTFLVPCSLEKAPWPVSEAHLCIRAWEWPGSQLCPLWPALGFSLRWSCPAQLSVQSGVQLWYR